MIRLLSTFGLLAALLTPGAPASAAVPAADPAAQGGRLVAITDQDYDDASAARIRLMDRVSKSTETVVATYDLRAIKSVSSMPNGQVVRTAPKSGCRTTWCTDTVDFAEPDATRTLPGAQIYKARVWSSRYE